MAKGKKIKTPPAQTQSDQPGKEHKMTPKPETEARHHRGTGKLAGKVAIITGGDSGIGRAIAIAFAKEGADVVIGYLNEHKDARETRRLVEAEGGGCLLVPGDVGQDKACTQLVTKTIRKFGRLDVVINNAAEQHPQDKFQAITEKQLVRTFRTNIFSCFFLTKAALPHLKKGSTIINCTSVTAYRGSEHLIDYSATKGAMVAFTRSLAKNLAEKGIRVNGVAPGPIWTPLIPSTFDRKHVKKFGEKVPLGRVGQPSEVAPCFVFLASEDSSYMSGQVLHPNGGEIING